MPVVLRGGRGGVCTLASTSLHMIRLNNTESSTFVLLCRLSFQAFRFLFSEPCLIFFSFGVFTPSQHFGPVNTVKVNSTFLQMNPDHYTEEEAGHIEPVS